MDCREVTYLLIDGISRYVNFQTPQSIFFNMYVSMILIYGFQAVRFSVLFQLQSSDYTISCPKGSIFKSLIDGVVTRSDFGASKVLGNSTRGTFSKEPKLCCGGEKTRT